MKLQIKGSKLLKTAGIIMVIFGLIGTAGSAFIIYLSFTNPQLYSQPAYHQYVSLWPSSTPEQEIDEVMTSVEFGYYLILSLLFLRNGLLALRYWHDPMHAKKLWKRAIIMTVFTTIAMISAILHLDAANLFSALFTMAIDLLYLFGAVHNRREAEQAS